MKEELFATYFTEGTTRMIGLILCVNSWISKHCSQYRSDFQHQGSFSVLEQHLFFCSVQFSRSVVSDSLRPPLNRSTPGLDRKSTRLNSSHQLTSYAVFCLKKKR